MGTRGLTRRHSVAERVGSRRRNQQGKLKSVASRGLRNEQFEDRLLLSIAPDLIAVFASERRTSGPTRPRCTSLPPK